MSSSKSSKLIVRATSPSVMEFPFEQLDKHITPTDEFFVRDHFDSPQIDANAWRLRIEGAVDRPTELSLEHLKMLRTETKQATMECAGNGRSLLVPKKDGLPWGIGAVSNAEWTGVPLAAVLERAIVKKLAVEAIFEGADKGEIGKGSRPTGPFHYSRSMSIASCMNGNALLAFEMNGQALPREHGAPVRLIVPGWYGMASVKWLKRIIVTDRPFHGFFQTSEYARWVKMNDVPTRVPLSEIAPKAQIARPTSGETVPAGKPYRVHGAAWTGGGAKIAKVEVSTDGGATYSAAKLLDAPVVNAWQMWEWTWNAPAAGNHTIRARATDDRGRTQPNERDLDLESYMICHILPVDVIVQG